MAPRPPQSTLTVDSSGERGLLGIAFEPGYDGTGPNADRVYLYYTTPRTARSIRHNRIGRFVVTGAGTDTPTLGSAKSSPRACRRRTRTATSHGRRLEPQRRRHPLRPGRQALRGRRRPQLRRRLAGRARVADPDHAVRQDAPPQPGRHEPDRQPLLQRQRNQLAGRHLGAGFAEPVHLFHRTWHRPDLHQRCRRGHLGGDQQGAGGRQLRLGGEQRPAWEGFEIRLRHGRTIATRRWRTTTATRCRARPALPSPAASSIPRAVPSGQRTRASTSSPTSAPTSSASSIRPTPARSGTPDTSTAFASNTTGGAPVDLKVDSAGRLYFLSRNAGKVFRIEVAEPLITQQPADAHAEVGGEASFTVVATGAEPLQYQWEKFNGTSWNAINGANSATLTIDPVAAANAGDYRVVVSNSLGTATSDAATPVDQPTADCVDRRAGKVHVQPDDRFRRHRDRSGGWHAPAEPRSGGASITTTTARFRFTCRSSAGATLGSFVANGDLERPGPVLSHRVDRF